MEKCFILIKKVSNIKIINIYFQKLTTSMFFSEFRENGIVEARKT